MLIRDIMTTRVLIVRPGDPLKKAIDLIVSNNFNGLPVVDQDNTVIGIVTEYDLILKDSNIHIPTLLTLLKKISIYPQDKSIFKKQFERLFKLKVQDIMNVKPVLIQINEPIGEAAAIFMEHHKVNPLIVVDRNNRLMGVLSRYDILRLYYQENWDPILKKVSDKKYDFSEDDGSRIFEHEVKKLEQHYSIVTKTRSRLWLGFSLVFLFIGLVIAFALMLRIVIK